VFGDRLLRREAPGAFGVFKVQESLGTGALGPLHLALDPSTSQPVVVHTIRLRDRLWSAQPSISAVNALRALCPINIGHPSVARPLSCGVEGGTLYVVYPYRAGRTLDELLGDTPMPPADVVRLLTPVASAIDAAASSRLHHGLLTPRDIIVLGDQVSVTGFGLAQALRSAGVTADVQPLYSSPQRLAGAPPALADDVYSLGAIALRALVGTPAQPDDARVSEDGGSRSLRWVPKPTQSEVQALRSIEGADGRALRVALSRALSEDPLARPGATELLVRLRQALADDSAPASYGEDSAMMLFSSETPDEGSTSPDAAPTVVKMRPPSADPVPLPSREKARETEPARERFRGAASRDPAGKAPRMLSFDDAPAARSPVSPAASSHAVAVVPERRRRRLGLVAAVVFVGLGAAFAVGFFLNDIRRAIDPGAKVAEPQQALGETAAPVVPRAQPQSAPPASRPAGAPSTQQPSAAAQPQAPVLPAPQTPVGPAPPAAPPADSMIGRINVVSTPIGATVTLDGVERGTTPLVLRNLRLGERTIQVALSGHDVRQMQVTLTEASPGRSVEVPLRPSDAEPAPPEPGAAPGRLMVVSRPPGAQLFVDDSLVGKTPLLMTDVAPGSRRVRLELSGYASWTVTVQLEPNQRFRVEADLQP
jgi:serine/threonine protein kinase